MFTPPDNQQDEPAAGSTEEDIETPLVEELEDIPETDVHTMPNKFLRPAKLPKKKGKISWLILGIVVFIVLGGVIVSVVIYFSREKQASQPITQPQAVLNVNLTPPTPPVNENENANTNQSLDTPLARDQQRLADITELRSALNFYFAKHELFPESLNGLLAEFLTTIPENPLPGGEDYQYTVSDDQLAYQLTFVLEQGATMGNLKLSAGKYSTGPEGISIFQQAVNTNLNTNTGLPTLPSGPTEPTKPSMGLDSDEDKLTDIEENLYHTNSTLVDTDGDGYNDLEELLNLYNPTQGGGARLLDSGLVKIYQNSNYNYSLLYPTPWLVRSLTTDNREVIFTSNTGEFIEVIIQQNPLSLSAYNWYINQNPGINTSSLTTLLVDGLPAVQTADGLNTYLGAGSNIYIISYNIGTNQQMNFYSTYQFFLKTFMFVTPKEPENPEEPGSEE